MDPVTIGLIASAVIGGASSVAATPHMAQMNGGAFAGSQFLDFDNSGFSVSVGSGTAGSTNNKTGTPAATTLGAAAGLVGGGASPFSVLGLLGSPLGLILLGGAAWYFLKK